jgi:hypothetical protein
LVRRPDEFPSRFVKRMTCDLDCSYRYRSSKATLPVDSRSCQSCGASFLPHANEARDAFLRRMTCSSLCTKRLKSETRRMTMHAERRTQSRFVGDVPLSDGLFALVDPEDFDRVMGHLWRAKAGHKTTYARTKIDGHNVSLHRFVLRLPEGVDCDHCDGNGLDCRRSNLRPASASQNTANQTLRSDNKTSYRGVHLQGGRYRASIAHQGNKLSVGMFTTAVEAAKAYDDRARQLFGAFSRLNFPGEGEQAADVFSTVEPGCALLADDEPETA